MVCNNCGKQIEQDSYSCEFCGATNDDRQKPTIEVVGGTDVDNNAPVENNDNQADCPVGEDELKKSKNAFGVVGFILSLCLFPAPVVGLVCSIFGMRRAHLAPYHKRGKRLAYAGLIISSVHIACVIIGYICYSIGMVLGLVVGLADEIAELVRRIFSFLQQNSTFW